MIEVKRHRGLVVTIRTGQDCEGPMAKEYTGYEITIESDAPTVRISGCHDMQPDFTESFA